MIRSIVGVDHVGIGVRDKERTRSFYANVFGYDQVLAEMPEDDHTAIRGLLRTPHAHHSAVLLGTRHEGLTVALFQATEPAPRPIRRDARYGDIGVGKITVAVPDVDAFCSRSRKSPVDLCFAPRTVRFGEDTSRFAYMPDPEGNLIEIVSDRTGTAVAAPIVRSVGIAVTDLDRSLAFYKDVLGFDTVAIMPHESFSGLLDEITGARDSMVRSCLLSTSRGAGMLELFEVTKPRGRSIPFGTQWGDYGYLQVCLRGKDRRVLSAEIEAEGVDILLPFQSVDDAARPAEFMYVRDPDGVLVEILV